MFDELEKYKHTGHFFFKPVDNLTMKCNAPTDEGGVYLVYALSKGNIELVYVGSSGQKQVDGTLKIRKAGLGGIKDRIVNGHQFGKNPRRKSWPVQMLKEKIEALDIYWWITHEGKLKDFPEEVEHDLLQKFYDRFGRLPRWNKEI